MIRTITNDTITSRVDMQTGRNGATRRVDTIHIFRQGTEDRGEIVVEIKADGKSIRLIMHPSAARQMAEWLDDQAI